MPQPSFSRATAIQSLRTHEGIESLRSNLREEHMLKMDWVSAGPGCHILALPFGLVWSTTLFLVVPTH